MSHDEQLSPEWAASKAAAAEPELCQLVRSPRATEEFTSGERLGMTVDKQVRRTLRSARKVVADPLIVLRKAARRAPPEDTASAGRVIHRPDPPLSAGERVRVRSVAEIEATYDEKGTCGGMFFLPIVMQKFCGRTFTVRGRIDRFFDERNWRMLKLRDTVILDGVFCEPPRDAGVDWAGCGRSCFLFWKEAWLERIDGGDTPSNAATDADSNRNT